MTGELAQKGVDGGMGGEAWMGWDGIRIGRGARCYSQDYGHSILDAHAFYFLQFWLSWVRCFAWKRIWLLNTPYHSFYREHGYVEWLYVERVSLPGV